MQPEANYNLELIKSQIGLAKSSDAVRKAAAAGSSASAASASSKSAGDADSKRWKTALDFQSLFMGQMYKAMRSTVSNSEITEVSPGRDIFTGMLDQEYASMDSKNPVEAGSEGLKKAMSKMSNSLAAQIYRALLRHDTGSDGVEPDAIPFSSAAGLARSMGGRKAYSDAKAPTLDKDALESLADAASKAYGVAKSLIKSVIGQESGNKPQAVSAAGAKGLMQLMDTTAQDMGVRNVFNPRENVMAGTRYLKQMLDRYDGDEKKALAAYNAGPAAVDRFGGIPPYTETRDYVEKVLKAKTAMDEQEAAKAPEKGKE